MKLFFSVIGLLLFTITSYAKNDIFLNEVNRCFEHTKPNKMTCSKTKSCFRTWQTEEAKKCVAQLGLTEPDCNAKFGHVQCDEPMTSKLFKQARNCRLDVSGSDNSSPNTELNPIENSIAYCSFNDYELFQIPFPAESAMRQKDGTWKIEKIGFPVGLEKILKPENVKIVGIINVDSSTTWSLGDGSMCPEGDDPSDMTREGELIERDRIKKELGFEKLTSFYPERHFIGRNGPKHFPLIYKFKNKQIVKLCGAMVPAGTELSAILDPPSCNAAVDGAISLSGFPKSFLPKDSQGNNPKAVVVCAPKAQAASQLYGLFSDSDHGKKKIVLPKLDWQKCDCSAVVPTEFRD